MATAARTLQLRTGDARDVAVVDELIDGWHRVNGARPQGAPVGMTVAEDGAIWLVEDKNSALQEKGKLERELGQLRGTIGRIIKVILWDSTAACQGQVGEDHSQSILMQQGLLAETNMQLRGGGGVAH